MRLKPPRGVKLVWRCVAAVCDLEGVAVCTLVGQSMSIGVSPKLSVTAGKRCWVHSDESLVHTYSHYHVQYTLCLMATCPRHQGVQWHVWRDQWWVVHRVNTYGAVATVVCTLITHSRTIVQHAHSRSLQPSQLRHRDTQKHRGACCQSTLHPCTHALMHTCIHP